MQPIVTFCAPRTWHQAALVFCFFQALIQLFHLGAEHLLSDNVASTHMLSGSIVALITSTPFIVFALALMHRQLALSQYMTKLARTDDLTGLPNRREFFRLADQSVHLEDAQLLMLDVDHFKRLNDTYGHAHGDQCLIAIADNMRRLCGPSAIMARLGGEEFVILLPGHSPSAASQLAWALTGRFAFENYGKQETALTVSVGVAAGEPHSDLTQLMNHADKALYDAKAAGRACVVTWSNEDPSNVMSDCGKTGSPVLTQTAVG